MIERIIRSEVAFIVASAIGILLLSICVSKWVIDRHESEMTNGRSHRVVVLSGGGASSEWETAGHVFHNGYRYEFIDKETMGQVTLRGEGAAVVVTDIGDRRNRKSPTDKEMAIK